MFIYVAKGERHDEVKNLEASACCCLRWCSGRFNGCVRGGGANSTAKDGVIINSVMNSTSQASLNYNPFSSTALTGVVGALYEPLFYMNNLKDDPTKLEPLMGKSYTISDDAKTIDVTIRDGEKWSDGEPYTAEDVAYTFNLLNSNKALNTGGFAGSASPFSLRYTRTISRITSPYFSTPFFPKYGMRTSMALSEGSRLLMPRIAFC